MNGSMILHVGYSAFAVFISACSQVLLKKEAIQEHKSKIREYLNVRVISAYLIYILATLLSVAAMRIIPLSLDAVIQATGYIYVWIFDIKFFRESVNANKIIGMLMVIFGIIVFYVWR